jgi:hypothetical protein
MKVMNYICIAVCDDCGPTLLIKPDQISVLKIEDSYMGVALCSFCNRAIVSEMSKEFAEELKEIHNVKLLDWEQEG